MREEVLDTYIRQYIEAHDTRWAAAQDARTAMSKAGRNDPCPCGSGKKFKHCCGASA